MTTEVLAPERETRAVATRTAPANLPTAPANREPTEFDKILELAKNPNIPIERISQVIDLFQKVEREKARRAFDGAMAQAKAEFPPLVKGTHVKFSTSKGETEYDHETLFSITRAIDPVLGKYGLSYRYETSSRMNEPVRVKCIVTHDGGHYIENELEAGRDDSGGKNAIQAMGSALTYLQRYTLRAALGLAAGKDDDGRKSGRAPAEPQSEFISDAQAEEIRNLITRSGVSLDSFLDMGRIECVTDMLANQFASAKSLLEKKIAAKAKGGAK